MSASIGRSRDTNNKFEVKSAQALKENLCKNAIEPFFKYFNDENYNFATNWWPDEGGEKSVFRIFSRCVVCNVERLPELKSGVILWSKVGSNQSQCHPCFLKFMKVHEEMRKKSPEIYQLFCGLYRKRFYKPFPHQKVYNGGGKAISYTYDCSQK